MTDLGKYTIHMFPPGVILLQKELATGFHPTLSIALSKFPQTDTVTLIEVIAAHCGIVLDGAYNKEDINKLCAMLSGRLEVMREFSRDVQTIVPFTQ